MVKHFNLLALVLSSFLCRGQDSTMVTAAPARFKIYKAKNVQIKKLKDFKNLITDSLENPKAYILGQINSGTEENVPKVSNPFLQWSIAIKRDNQYYVFYPFEKSVIEENVSEIRTVRLKRAPLLQNGKQLIELTWQSIWGYGNNYSGGTFEKSGIQLWDFNAFVRHLDFLLMRSSSEVSDAEPTYACKAYEYEYTKNSLKLILLNECLSSSIRRKVNDTTVAYHYRFGPNGVALFKKEPHIIYANPATVPAHPAFLRIITCNSGDASWFYGRDKSSIGFWFVNSDFKVGGGETEFVMDRSGKTLVLCEGNYALADLENRFRSEAASKPLCASSTFGDYISSCRRPRGPDQFAPYVFLAEGEPNYISSKDNLTIYTSLKKAFDVYLRAGIDEEAYYQVDSDRIKLKFELLTETRYFQVNLKRPRPHDRWEHEFSLRILKPGDLADYQTGKKEYAQKLGDASEDFKTLSLANFMVMHGLLTEAHMIMRGLFEKNEGNSFYETAYFSFLQLHYTFGSIENLSNRP